MKNNAAVAVRLAKTGRRSERHRSRLWTSRANGEPHQRLLSVQEAFEMGGAILSMSANGRRKMIFAARHPATEIRTATRRDGPCPLYSYLPTLVGTSRFDIDIPIRTDFKLCDPTKDLGLLRP